MGEKNQADFRKNFNVSSEILPGNGRTFKNMPESK